MSTRISSIDPGSPAQRAGIRPGDELLKINGNTIIDVLDYKFYGYDANTTLELASVGGEVRTVNIKKSEGRELGLNFESYLIDTPHSCANRCIFCFIDQLPHGMRESLYFKDDDARMSFLLGNYITLTNLTEREIQRIIDLRISPVNISVHTTNPQLRCEMLGNRFAGRGFELMKRFAEAELRMNAQIVCCPGINDGAELARTMNDLKSLFPAVEGVSVVPLGLTKHRENLPELRPYTKELALETARQVDSFGQKCLEELSHRIFYCADELYILAQLPIPDEDYYEGFTHLENGVGMIRLQESQFNSALEFFEPDGELLPVSIATGEAAAPFLQKLIDLARIKWNNIDVNIYPIRNDFFGPSITVAGLVTGGDIIEQLKGKDLGSRLLLPDCMLRAGETIFLDDYSVADVEKALDISIEVVEDDGGSLLDAIIGNTQEVT